MNPEITVYTRTTCAPCQTLKAWFARKGLKYNERNIDTDKDAQAAALKLTGYSIVPVTLIKTDGREHVIAGLNISSIASLV